jgi:hypothetical protein
MEQMLKSPHAEFPVFFQERYEATCTATGFPEPTVRLLLIPSAELTLPVFDDDAGRFPMSYQRYELSESSSWVNVTSTARNEKTLSFYWDNLYEHYKKEKPVNRIMFVFKCAASNTHQSVMVGRWL